MKEVIDETIEADSRLRGLQFHELSVPSLKNVIRRAIEVIVQKNSVISARITNMASNNAADMDTEEVWLRQLLHTWFTKQFTNRRTERLHAKKKPAKGDVCPTCSGPARIQIQCDTCSPPPCEKELDLVFPRKVKTNSRK